MEEATAMGTQSTAARFPAARGGGTDTALVHESGTAVEDERGRKRKTKKTKQNKKASGIREEEDFFFFK